MSFSKVNSAGWSVGDKLTAAQMNAFDGYVSSAMDIRTGNTNTVASNNGFTGVNTFQGTVNINGQINASNTAVLDGQVYIYPDILYSFTTTRSLILPISCFKLYGVTGLYGGSNADGYCANHLSEITRVTPAARTTPLSNLAGDATRDGELGNLVFSPYFKLNYYNVSTLKQLAYGFDLDLSRLPVGAIITGLKILYDVTGYGVAAANASEAITFAFLRTPDLNTAASYSTGGAQIGSNYTQSSTEYTYSSAGIRRSGWTGLTEVYRPDLYTYQLQILTGTYAGTSTACSHLFLGAIVTYTQPKVYY